MTENEYAEKLQPRLIIKCPHCGWEYLPGEIFYPDNSIGQPINVVRDPLGHILYEEYKEGKEPLAEERYICDNCDKQFVVSLALNIKSKVEEEELDFTAPTATLW